MNRIENEFEARKKKILKSAKKLFIKYGFDNVSLNQIAKDADFGKSTLYYYFSSKNEILYVIVRQYDLSRLKKSEVAFNKALGSYDKIYSYLKEYYNFVKVNNRALFMLTNRNVQLIYRDIIPNLSSELIETYERHFVKSAEDLKEQLKLGEQDGYFTKIKDKHIQLAYIMLTTRSVISFLFHDHYTLNHLTEEEIDRYFEIHLNIILKNL